MCCIVWGVLMFLVLEIILDNLIGCFVDIWFGGVLFYFFVVGYLLFWYDNSEKMLLVVV